MLGEKCLINSFLAQKRCHFVQKSRYSIVVIQVLEWLETQHYNDNDNDDDDKWQVA